VHFSAFFVHFFKICDYFQLSLQENPSVKSGAKTSKKRFNGFVIPQKENRTQDSGEDMKF
jgi:hypothetical protein